MHFNSDKAKKVIDLLIVPQDEKYGRNNNENEEQEDDYVMLCTDCGIIFNTSQEYNVHVEAHKKLVKNSSVDSRVNFVNEKYYVCTQCGTLCPSEEDLRRHTSIHNCRMCGRELSGEKNGDNRECFECKKTLLGSPNKKGIGNKTKQVNHVCTICKRVFTHKTNLTRHSHLHKGPENYACRVCGVSFSILSTLTKHMISAHT